jgi:phosphodiesterase/alkaline phosphatase D-like protein
MRLTGLPPGEEVFYRVTFTALDSPPASPWSGGLRTGVYRWEGEARRLLRVDRRHRRAD